MSGLEGCNDNIIKAWLNLQLHKLGYTNIDGLEPAENIVQTMPYRDVYSNIIIECLGEGETSVADGKCIR